MTRQLLSHTNCESSRLHWFSQKHNALFLFGDSLITPQDHERISTGNARKLNKASTLISYI